MTKKYGDLADHTKILSELKKIVELLMEQNDIMMFDSEGCCSECDGTCDKTERFTKDS